MAVTITERAWIEPRTMFAEWQQRPHCVWLDSATPGRYSILTADPFHVLRASGGDPFPALAIELERHHVHEPHPFPVGAAIGYFGYGLNRFIEKVPTRVHDDIGLPDLWFGFYDHLLVFDHTEKRIWQVGRDRRARRATECGRPGDPSRPLRSNFTRAEYCRTVQRAKEYIAAGDIYQVNLSQRFQCDVGLPATVVYEALRTTNPAPYSAYLDIGDAQILSTSPECFLQIHDRDVVTRPIKGTLPRDRDPSDLLRSPKDNAELVMITDLERNDLGRVCEFGSVHVPDLVRVETYATVHHLVATVAGRLRANVSHVDCVRACFPGGSITGAPKIRAMEIIDELEPHARGVYTGAIGFLGFNGVTHLNIAIRTVIQQKQRLTFHAGGGIVADSEPEAEYEETLAKARGIIDGIEQLRVRQRSVPA